MTEKGFTITPEELVTLHDCLSSKICVNIFQVLLKNPTLNITAISRKAGCTNSDAQRHLRNLAKLGIVSDEFYAGRHTFILKNGQLTELLKQTVRIMDAKE